MLELFTFSGQDKFFFVERKTQCGVKLRQISIETGVQPKILITLVDWVIRTFSVRIFMTKMFLLQ